MTKILRNIMLGILVLACAFVLAFAGCSGDEPDVPSEDTDMEVPGGENIPEDTENEESGEEYIPEEKTVYTVTFDLNYDGGTSFTVSVEEGSTVPIPSDSELVREGYVFSTWYTDVSCGEDYIYDFTAPVTGNMTLYAGWIDMSSVDEDDILTITYMWNYGDMGVYMTRTYEYNDRVGSLYTAEREGYMLMGWYTEPECVSQYFGGNSERITESITLYALWYEGFVFEAEYTDLTDGDGAMRNFQGYSLNGDPVLKDSSCSNGYYIGDMYVNECYIYFEIVSDMAVDDAQLYLSLAMAGGYLNHSENGILTITSDMYSVTVNGDKVSYDDLVYDVSNLVDSSTDSYTAFEEVFIGSVRLNAGTNVIRLEVSNVAQGNGGTMKAIAPLVDYMLIYSGSVLTWDPVLTNI